VSPSDLERAVIGPSSKPRHQTTAEYARGSGFSDPQWARFNEQQLRAAAENDLMSQQLRSMAETMRAGGTLSRAQEKTLARFGRIMGKGAATAEALAQVADYLSQSSKVLRSQDEYVADGYTAKEWAKMREARLTRGLADRFLPTTLAAVPDSDPRRMYINLGHDEANTLSKLRWAVLHESLHASPTRLRDQKGTDLERAYRFGTAPQRAAYRELTRAADGRSVINPDHITAFALGKNR
jgi:hypothetical protein